MAGPSKYPTRNKIGAAKIVDLQYIFAMAGEMSVGDDKTLRLVVGQLCTVIGAYAYAKTGPTGASMNIEVEAATGLVWRTVISSANLQIAALSNSGEYNDASQVLLKNDLLRVNIDQVGAVVAGSDVTVHLRVRF